MAPWKSLLVVCLIFLIGCSLHSAPPRTMSPVATAYLHEVLAIMQQRALHRDTIDWERFRGRLFALAEGAQTTADTYRAIRFMVTQLGDNHSSFLPPEQAQQLESTLSHDTPIPRGTLLAGRIGYVWLPYLVGDGPHATTYSTTLQHIIRELDAQQPCGWIVDLTENQGGNMWPMLAGIGPILGEGNVGFFLHPDGQRDAWSYNDGHAFLGSTIMAQSTSNAYTLQHPGAPVAVLTSSQTASSGEAIAVAFRGRPDTRSFGQPTAGLSTGNETYTLSDGAVLILTEVVFADRTGRTYGSALMPDERPWLGGSPQALATTWLLQQPACTG